MELTEYELISTNSAFILKKDSVDYEVHIDRSINQIIKRKPERRSIVPSEKIFGIFGIIQLPSSNYLILITKATHVCRIKSHFIYLIQDIDFRAFNSISPDSSAFKSEQEIIHQLKSLILTDSFYFSYDYDLSLTMQAISGLDTKSKNIHERADEKYFWNKHLSDSLIKAEAHDFVLVVINGFIQGESVDVKGKRLDYILLSRRDKRRTGTRFNTRGLDDQGNAVNYVETEQIVVFLEDNLKVFSHVQIRGSIPLVWSQKPDLSWTPRPKVSISAQQNSTSAEIHFNELYKSYGSVSMINLIDKKGSQKMIGSVFSGLCNLMSCNNLHYTWFDFHHECKNMKYENLRLLLKDLQSLIEEFSWFESKVDPSEYFDKGIVIKRQNGVFRTNCMDCLDRTNVVQSVIARNILLRQLNSVELGPLPTGEAFQAFSNSLESKFRDLWVRNADVMSLLYSGTPAQKTDFTKFGKRTYRGAMNDGIYSLQRFVINNFLDGSKQNTIDLMLGKLALRNGINLNWKFISLAWFIGIFLALSIVASFFAGRSEGAFYWVKFLIALALMLNILKAYSSLVVDKPIINTN